MRHSEFADRSPIEIWLRKILNTADTGWGERGGDYAELAHYMTRGFLTAHVKPLPVTEVVLEIPHTLEGGENDRHRYAKAEVIAWIKSLGGEPEREPLRYNGRVDVFCPKLHICVECGSLSPNRLLDMVMDPEVDRAITIPFGDDETAFSMIEWKMAGDWMTESRIRQEERFLRLQKASECLNL